jgi:hypothetical protein
MTEAQLAKLWRRQFECMDALLHGFLLAEGDRSAGREPGPAAVTYAELAGERHGLSVPRFHPQERLRPDHFRHSDPFDALYAGKFEADFISSRTDLDAEFT